MLGEVEGASTSSSAYDVNSQKRVIWLRELGRTSCATTLRARRESSKNEANSAETMVDVKQSYKCQTTILKRVTRWCDRDL